MSTRLTSRSLGLGGEKQLFAAAALQCGSGTTARRNEAKLGRTLTQIAVGALVSFYSDPLSLEVGTVELPNNPQPRVIGRHRNQAMALSHSRRIGNQNNAASDNSRRGGERKAKNLFKNLIGKRSQVGRPCRIGDSGNN